MMTISSPAGRRLAKAVAEYREHEGDKTKPSDEMTGILMDLVVAALKAGDELCADGFHLMDGED